MILAPFLFVYRLFIVSNDFVSFVNTFDISVSYHFIILIRRFIIMTYQDSDINRIFSQLAKLELQIAELKSYIDATNSANTDNITLIKNILSDK